MANTVLITGRFLDLGGNPLQGTVTIEPAPEYIADADKVSIYSGSTSADLAEDGSLSLPVVAFPGRLYRVLFNLRKGDGGTVKMEPAIIKIPKADTMSNLLANIIPATTRVAPDPVFEFVDGDSGAIFIEGATISPNDPGAIVITIP